MNRREAIQAGGLLAAGAALSACGLFDQPPPREVLFADDEALAVAIADTILPDTDDSPGAAAAGIGPVLDLLLTRCRDQATQGRIVTGLEHLRTTCRHHCNAPFADLPRADREHLLRGYLADARRTGGPHWFTDFRDLVLHAYFTSEVGMTQALRYVRDPGRWVGCVPLEPGQRAWA